MPTDSNGKFTIKNVIPGIYALHGWVPGFIGDYLDQKLVTITAGKSRKREINMLHHNYAFIYMYQTDSLRS